MFDLIFDSITSIYFLVLTGFVIVICLPGWLIAKRKGYSIVIEVVIPIISLLIWIIMIDRNIGGGTLSNFFLEMQIAPIIMVILNYFELFCCQQLPKCSVKTVFNKIVFTLCNIGLIVLIRICMPNISE